MSDRELLELIAEAERTAARQDRPFVASLRKLRLLGASEALIHQVRATRPHSE